MFKLLITSRARKELKLISKSHRIALKQVLAEIREYPNIGKPLNREFTNKFSYRAGVHRIIYKIDTQNRTVYILTAGHRARVYTKK